MAKIEQLIYSLKSIEMELREHTDKLNKQFGNIFDIDETIREFSKYTRESGYPKKEIPIVTPILPESIIEVIYDVEDRKLKFSLPINDDRMFIISDEIVCDFMLSSLLNQYDFLIRWIHDKLLWENF